MFVFLPFFLPLSLSVTLTFCETAFFFHFLDSHAEDIMPAKSLREICKEKKKIEKKKYNLSRFSPFYSTLFSDKLRHTTSNRRNLLFKKYSFLFLLPTPHRFVSFSLLFTSLTNDEPDVRHKRRAFLVDKPNLQRCVPRRFSNARALCSINAQRL